MDNVSLIIRDSDGTEHAVDLPKGTTQIGRAEDVDITLPSQSVSRLHAQVIVGEDQVRIEDLDSGNGLTFRGQRVASLQLLDGHEIHIEPYTLVFKIPELPDTEVLQRDLTTPHLEVVAGAGLSANHITIGPAPRVTIGRAEDQDVILPDRSASRTHCVLERESDGWYAVNAGAANGLLVNAENIERQALKTGDLIQIGDTVLRFVDPQGTQPLASAVTVEGPPASPSRVPWLIGCAVLFALAFVGSALLVGLAIAVKTLNLT